MKTATGEYINMYSEIGVYDSEDLKNEKLDIFVLFAEHMAGCMDMKEAEKRIRKVLGDFKKSLTGRETVGTLGVLLKILRANLEDEFMEESVLVVVKVRI